MSSPDYNSGDSRLAWLLRPVLRSHMLSGKQRDRQMAKRKTRYRDLLSPFDLIWERDGLELARERVLAESAESAQTDSIGLSANHGIDIFDDRVRCRVEKVNA